VAARAGRWRNPMWREVPALPIRSWRIGDSIRALFCRPSKNCRRPIGANGVSPQNSRRPNISIASLIGNTREMLLVSNMEEVCESNVDLAVLALCESNVDIAVLAPWIGDLAT
jgi:hypothetical protein